MSDTQPSIRTLGELKASGYQPKSVKMEMRDNLISLLKKRATFAPGILGYDETVFPQIHQAILSRHDFILLGLRGQGKSRILKNLTNLLDEWIPVIADSPINEDPVHPILNHSKHQIESLGDDLPIQWLHRSDRFSEKLATPDVSMADLIGDIDPIKAAQEGLTLNNPDVIDFGLIPKSNRGIFAINELADLQPRIQVGLFNIMEEKTVQIKGFPIHFALDTVLVYTANPEDYTARGSIITPLKDRIDSQIITHYPRNREIGLEIAKQESSALYREAYFDRIPDYLFNVIEQIVIEARKSDVIDQSSGVSARLSISALENVIAAAEERSIRNDEPFNIRINDLYAAVPAITGKIELLYEGEQEGAIKVAEGLIGQAIDSLFDELAPKDMTLIDDIKANFEQDSLNIDHTTKNDAYVDSLNKIDKLSDFAKLCHFIPNGPDQKATFMHFIIEAMVMRNYLSKFRFYQQTKYDDMMSSLFS